MQRQYLGDGGSSLAGMPAFGQHVHARDGLTLEEIGYPVEGRLAVRNQVQFTGSNGSVANSDSRISAACASIYRSKEEMAIDAMEKESAAVDAKGKRWMRDSTARDGRMTMV